MEPDDEEKDFQRKQQLELKLGVRRLRHKLTQIENLERMQKTDGL